VDLIKLPLLHTLKQLLSFGFCGTQSNKMALISFVSWLLKLEFIYITTANNRQCNTMLYFLITIFLCVPILHVVWGEYVKEQKYASYEKENTLAPNPDMDQPSYYYFLISGLRLWVLRPLLAFCTSLG
jgi:hypothetical protein